MIKKIKENINPTQELSDLIDFLHQEGPKDPYKLEELTYYKEFHPSIFAEFEEKIISALGLFYKIDNPKNLYSFVMQGFGEEHRDKYGSILTPVQASIRRAIDDSKYISISAPTSAGKSYSIRDFIAEGTGDAVIIVPSRALIAEYINAMRRKFEGDKSVMITSFVDLIYSSRQLRRIFVLTPERSKDLYALKEMLNIQTFFFDEAQISEERTRGVIFDVTVRRIKKHFPSAKIIFAHPFVENPEAQFSKHQFPVSEGYAHSYKYGTVGKICIARSGKKNYYFSPYIEGSHLKKNCVEFGEDFRNFALNGEHSILVYVSKNSIYNEKFKDGFQDYISSLQEITSPEAKEIIESIRHIVGADKPDHNSSLVELLNKGVVIHHGSIPLEVRFLIEDFIRKGFSSICFATSTLAQGINMPFDIVWIENNRFDGNEEERALAFKNLIGRAGRLTDEKIFDYGYVYTANAKLFSQRIQISFSLSEESVLENPPSGEHDNDEIELIESIQNDTFNDEKNISNSKVERLSNPFVLMAVEEFLNIFYKYPKDIKESIGGATNKLRRDQAKHLLKKIYGASLGRELQPGENNVFNQAIDIFFHVAQGRSFSEIVGIRYKFIAARDDKFETSARFSQPAKKLPNSSLVNRYSIFKDGTPKEQVSYDSIIYDTYDYLDQVLSFSLSDTLIAAFEIYNESQNDKRAEDIIELLRYGTNNKLHILLMRYGFPPEVVGDIAAYIDSIDEAGIIFSPTIRTAPKFIQDIVEWYLPN